MSGQDKYLWDRSGPTEPDVEELERMLGSLGHRGGEPPAPVQEEPPRRWRTRMPRRWLRGGALALAAGLAVAWLLGVFESASRITLRVEQTGVVLVEGTRHVPPSTETIEMSRDGEFTAELTLATNSELEVRSLDGDQAELFLHRGRMEAFVTADARPRFFQVGTPAARCVDLGCQYTLVVDDAQNAEVEVLIGKVAFENEGREVLVLAGATCRAHRDRGAGTPRFIASPPEFKTALDAFDSASGPPARQAAARLALTASASEADDRKAALPLWHLMGDVDAVVAANATELVEKRFGRPVGLLAGPGRRPMDQDLETWKEHLDIVW